MTHTVSRAVFQGNDVAVDFPFAFKVWDVAQLAVILTDKSNVDSPATSWTATLSPGEEGGGTLHYVHEGRPLPTGWKLTVLRNMPFVQNVDLISGTRFDPQVIENQLDQATAERQQLKEGLARAVQVPPSSESRPEDLLNDIWAARFEAVGSAGAAAESAREADGSAAASAGSANQSATSAAAARASAEAAQAAQVSIDSTVAGAVGRVEGAGDTQVARITAEGNTQVTRLQGSSSLLPAANAVPRADAEGRLSPLWLGAYVGKVELLLCPHDMLPAGYYFLNGQGYNISTPQAQRLDWLSKQAWWQALEAHWVHLEDAYMKILTIGVNRYLPTWFMNDSRGPIMRAVNGRDGFVGCYEPDAVQVITGHAEMHGFDTGGFWSNPETQPNSAVFASSFMDSYQVGTEKSVVRSHYHGISFDSSRCVRSATETRVLSRGMTPAIFLGV